MEWENLIGIITAVIAFGVLPLILRARKKAGPQKMDGLLGHLQSNGVKASFVEKGAREENIGRSMGQKSEGLIRLEGRKINYINIIGVSSQYGTNYFLDYLVLKPGSPVEKHRKKTVMTRKRGSTLWGRTVDIEWKGDEYLSRELNYDFGLKDTLMYTKPDELKGGIQIHPEPKHEYARIRTAYLLPSSELFGALELIAGHIRSLW